MQFYRFSWVIFGYTVVSIFLLSPLIGWVASSADLAWQWIRSEGAPAWIQAVGSIAAIMAAWFIPYRQELIRKKNQRIADLDTLNWISLRMRNQLQHMREVLDDPGLYFEFWQECGAFESWGVHKSTVDTFQTGNLCGDDVVLLLNLREVAVGGLKLAERIQFEYFENNERFIDASRHLQQIDHLWHQADFVFDETTV
ncbi:TPA: hypothetical protein ACXI2A_001523 [Pseudomonas aeruginosa]|uniref:hypothetical protein n=1 Tax=Pseudomonas aeruginosa TaxID=287 RepID=UPI0029D476F5|nr:hypothetical protein [Pseudomonas aeruginosa]